MAKRTPDSRELKTKEEVIAALGGIQGLCALTGSSYGATENWKRLKTFPTKYSFLMLFALHKKGLSAPPELWGLVTPEDRKNALKALIAIQKRKIAA